MPRVKSQTKKETNETEEGEGNKNTVYFRAVDKPYDDWRISRLLEVNADKSFKYELLQLTKSEEEKTKMKALLKGLDPSDLFVVGIEQPIINWTCDKEETPTNEEILHFVKEAQLDIRSLTVMTCLTKDAKFQLFFTLLVIPRRTGQKAAAEAGAKNVPRMFHWLGVSAVDTSNGQYVQTPIGPDNSILHQLMMNNKELWKQRFELAAKYDNDYLTVFNGKKGKITGLSWKGDYCAVISPLFPPVYITQNEQTVQLYTDKKTKEKVNDTMAYAISPYEFHGFNRNANKVKLSNDEEEEDKKEYYFKENTPNFKDTDSKIRYENITNEIYPTSASSSSVSVSKKPAPSSQNKRKRDDDDDDKEGGAGEVKDNKNPTKKNKTDKDTVREAVDKLLGEPKQQRTKTPPRTPPRPHPPSKSTVKTAAPSPATLMKQATTTTTAAVVAVVRESPTKQKKETPKKEIKDENVSSVVKKSPMVVKKLVFDASVKPTTKVSDGDKTDDSDNDNDNNKKSKMEKQLHPKKEEVADETETPKPEGGTQQLEQQSSDW